jgi:hypothetical protein
VTTLPPALVRFEGQLEDAIRRRRARRPRTLALRAACVGAATAAVALGVLSILPGDGPSVVERATAALTVTDGTILHVVVTATTTGPDGVDTPMTVERWEETEAPYDTREIVLAGDRRFESAQVGGLTQVYDAATNTIYSGELGAAKADVAKPGAIKPGAVKPGSPDGAAKAGAGKPGAGQGADTPPPGRGDQYREKILVLLRSGNVHEDGRLVAGDRDAIRLVSGDGSVELVVDAGTYEPIEWRVSEGGRTAVASFPTYERLPASAANRALVSLPALHPGATVDTSDADLRAALQRLAPKQIDS